MTASAWNQEQLFSTTEKGSERWETPDSLFKALDAEFGFDLDAAADEQNSKVQRYITREENALSVDWSERGSTVWLNPPYGRDIPLWMSKAYEESRKGVTVVVLIFARTDTRWWHDYASKADEIRFIRGRIHFKRADGHTGPSTAPSSVLVFSGGDEPPKVSHVELPRK